MSSLFFDILMLSEFFKISKCTKFVWKKFPPFLTEINDILMLSEFFKISKLAKFIWKWISSFFERNQWLTDAVGVFQNIQVGKIRTKMNFLLFWPKSMTYWCCQSFSKYPSRQNLYENYFPPFLTWNQWHTNAIKICMEINSPLFWSVFLHCVEKNGVFDYFLWFPCIYTKNHLQYIVVKKTCKLPN